MEQLSYATVPLTLFIMDKYGLTNVGMGLIREYVRFLKSKLLYALIQGQIQNAELNHIFLNLNTSYNPLSLNQISKFVHLVCHNQLHVHFRR